MTRSQRFVALFLTLPIIAGMVLCAWYEYQCQQVRARAAGYTEGFQRGVEVGTETGEVQQPAVEVSEAMRDAHDMRTAATDEQGVFTHCVPAASRMKFQILGTFIDKSGNTHYRVSIDTGPDDPPCGERPRRLSSDGQIHIYPFHRGYADIGFPLKPPPMVGP